MKKTLLTTLAFISTLSLVACGKQENTTQTTSEKETVTTETATKKEEKIKKNYKLGEWWEVPNQWKLKVDSVTPTDERNEYSEKEPEQVVIINYSYENLGYEKDIQDLYLTPENVIDSAGNMAETYPANTDTSPKPTPIGAKMNGAQEAYGLITKNGTIKITFSQYDNEKNQQSATFEVPVK